MKRCPECRRDYHDDTLAFCLEDGTALLQGSVPSPDEPQTAILHETAPPIEAATRAQIHTTEAEAQGVSGYTEQKRGVPPDKAAKPQSRHLALVGGGLALLILVGGFLAYRYFSNAAAGQIDSIAVLPFQNVGGDPNFEYLSDGIAESLINSLTQIQQLKVIARNTAFRYKGKDVDAEQVGRDLSVRAVLTGRVRQVGDRLNIQVDLIDAVTGAQLWGEEYERPASDVLSIKQAISREITDNLRLRLSGEQQQRLTARETTNAEAYQSYLRGRFYWNKRTAEGIKKAIAELQQAIERDPNYALGYAGLADCYVVLEDYPNISASETLPKAKAYAERALQIDDSLAEPHASIALVYHKQWQWNEAEKEYKRSIELNPNYPTARQWYSRYLRIMGRFDESLSEAKRAQELDPLSLVISNNLAMGYLAKGDLNSAVEQGKKTFELDPNFQHGFGVLAIAYLKQESYHEAISVLEKGLADDQPARYTLVGYAYALSGRRAEALAALRKLEEEYAKQKAIGTEVALVYEGLGEREQAFAWLEKDFQARRAFLPDIRWAPTWDSIREDPRYRDLVQRMGLQP